jgi:hypothetical protein
MNAPRRLADDDPSRSRSATGRGPDDQTVQRRHQGRRERVRPGLRANVLEVVRSKPTQAVEHDRTRAPRGKVIGPFGRTGQPRDAFSARAWRHQWRWRWRMRTSSAKHGWLWLKPRKLNRTRVPTGGRPRPARALGDRHHTAVPGPPEAGPCLAGQRLRGSVRLERCAAANRICGPPRSSGISLASPTARSTHICRRLCRPGARGKRHRDLPILFVVGAPNDVGEGFDVRSVHWLRDARKQAR